jgi:hypothetical protein
MGAGCVHVNSSGQIFNIGSWGFCMYDVELQQDVADRLIGENLALDTFVLRNVKSSFFEF